MNFLFLLFKTIVAASVPSGSWGNILFIYIQPFYDQKAEKGTLFPGSAISLLHYWMRWESAVGNKPAADVLRLLQPIKCNLWKDPGFPAIMHVAVCNYPCARSSFTADQVSISTFLLLLYWMFGENINGIVLKMSQQWIISLFKKKKKKGG